MPSRSQEPLAWQNATASVVLALLGIPVEMAMGHAVAGMPMWPFLISLGTSAVLLVVLLVWRTTLTATLSTIIFMINNIGVALALWLTADHFASAPEPWTPFEPYKLSVLAVALLAPPDFLVGLGTIVMFSGSGLLRYFCLDEATRSRLSPAEPYAILAFGLFAAVLLVYRLRSLALYEALATSRAKTATLESTTRRFLAIRDLANTPLQTLEATVVLLARIPGTTVHVERMRRALERLRDWNRLLHEEPTSSAWKPQRESFDAQKILSERGPAKPPH